MKKLLITITVVLLSLSIYSQSLDEIGFYSINGIEAIDYVDNCMVLGNGHIVDISDPTNPSLKSNFSVYGDGVSVNVVDDYAYFGTGMGNSLYIADISNTAFPLGMGVINFTVGNGIFGTDAVDNTLMVSLANYHPTNLGLICSIDIADKSNPIVLDTIFFEGGRCTDVAVISNYAYAAAGGGLKVIDISNPADLQVIKSIGSGYNSIDKGDDKLIVGKSGGGIDVFDISELTNPIPAYSIPNGTGSAWEVRYQSGNIYLSTNYGVFIYKMEANSAYETAHFSSYGQAFGVCPHDSLVFLPGLVLGVSILHYDESGTVGINYSTVNNQLNIFPNPAKNSLTITNNGLNIDEYIIYDMNGQMVERNKFIDENTINISNFISGQYFIKIYTKQGIITKKFIKIE